MSNSTRRDFLALGAAALGTAALGRHAIADEPSTSPYGPFKMGLQSYSLRHFSFDDALAHTKAYGLHHWESYSAHIKADADANKLAEVKARAASAGVTIGGFGVVAFSKDVDKNRKLFDFARAMGLGYMSCAPSPDCFDVLDKLVEEYKIPVGIHNHGPEDKTFGKIDQITAAIKDHSPLIGCCIDAGHFLRSKEDPLRAVEVFDKRIYGVHLKDVKDARTFTILGEGDLKLVELLKMLKARKYNYTLALEYEENERTPDADIMACLKAARAAVARI